MASQIEGPLNERTCTIMLVDDDAEFAAEIEAVLSKRCEVIVASGSRQALARLLERSVDLAIVDVGLPSFLGAHRDDEGLILTRLLTEHHMIPAVVITNSNDQTLLRESIRAGAAAIEMKQNLSPETLWELVTRHARVRERDSTGDDG